MDNIRTAWLYPLILAAGALQAWGPPMNSALKKALINPWLSSLVSFLPSGVPDGAGVLPATAPPNRASGESNALVGAYFSQGRPRVHGKSVHGFTPCQSSFRDAGPCDYHCSDVQGQA